MDRTTTSGSSRPIYMHDRGPCVVLIVGESLLQSLDDNCVMIAKDLYSLSWLVKEVVSDIDTVSKTNLTTISFSIKINKMQSIYIFMKLYFKMNLLISLSYIFKLKQKRISLQLKFEMFDLRQTQNDFLYQWREYQFSTAANI